MQPGELAANTAAILAHAGAVESIAAKVATAKQAADTVRIDSTAYGQLCTLLPPMINFLQDIVIDAIAAADTSLSDTASLLRTAAAGYQAADHSSEQDLRKIGTGR